MERHVRLVAVLHIGLGILGLIGGTIVFFAVAGGGLLSGDPTAIAVTSVIGAVVSAFLFATSLPGLIGGIGLLKRKSWARILLLIVAVLDLFNVPIGTVVGVYTLWALLQDETARYLEGSAVL